LPANPRAVPMVRLRRFFARQPFLIY